MALQNLREDQKIMLFDLDIRGHHAGYIQHLINYWHNQNLPGKLDIIVVPEFIRRFPEVVKLAKSTSADINFIPIATEEEANLKTVRSTPERFQRSFQEWRLLKKYIKVTNCAHCLLMFFDSLLWRMCFGIKSPCLISSIFFRPVTHYRNFSNYEPSFIERFWEFREKVGLTPVLTSGDLENVFCLDPLAVDHLSKQYRETNIVYLPDPVQIYNSSSQQVEALRQSLGIETGRKVFLLFGVLSQRKGIYELLEAVKSLSPKLNQKLCLLMVGPIDEQLKIELNQMISDISQSHPIQIICRYNFISDQQIEPYFKIADTILAPYQRHVGMSAILVRAAAANKPVLSSDYGLMGEVTRAFGLGLVVDSEAPEEIAYGLTRYLTEPATNLCNYHQMKQFAEQNKAERFAEVVFENILS
jgi:glycosyltransferase involved in cell wall biosynthesis